MSKKGRCEPRLILFNVARTAINCNPLIKEIYEKHVKRGMPKMAAIGCVMHKILRIVFGMLKNKQNFDPDIDKRNREKSCGRRAGVERGCHGGVSYSPQQLRRPCNV